MQPWMETYFVGVVVGLPLLLLMIAMLAGYLHRNDHELAWTSQETINIQAQHDQNEITQLLAAQNALRRRRGLPERTLAEIIKNRC